jgi:hypothetical protein
MNAMMVTYRMVMDAALTVSLNLALHVGMGILVSQISVGKYKVLHFR